MVTINGAKLGGPRGIGMLYAHRGTPLSSVIYGGGQERGLRSGTEDVASISGFTTALTESRARAVKEAQRLSEMRDICIAEIKERFPQARVNGSLESRLPQNIHVSFKGYSSELLVLELDAKGISVSAGSACGATSEETSHVLTALYGKTPEQWGSIRVTVGYGTREKDLFTFLDALQNVFEKYKPWVSP
jgi:cysteine desulfurase